MRRPVCVHGARSGKPCEGCARALWCLLLAGARLYRATLRAGLANSLESYERLVRARDRYLYALTRAGALLPGAPARIRRAKRSVQENRVRRGR